jgi:hypothetical protein
MSRGAWGRHRLTQVSDIASEDQESLAFGADGGRFRRHPVPVV